MSYYRVIRRNASVSWVPTDLGSDCKAWYKADSLSQSDDTAVTTWTDSSGNGYDLTGYGGTKPKFRTAVLNSKPVIRFNASGYFKRAVWTGYPSNNSAITVAALVKRNATGGNDMFVTAGESGSKRQDNIRVHSTDDLRMLRRDAGGAFEYCNGSSNVGTGHHIIVAGVNSSTAAFIRLNGTAESITYGGAYSDMNMTDSTPDDFNVGALSDGTSVLDSGHEVVEVIVSHVKLSDENMERIEGYLAHKYALTGNLPQGHPYRSAAPTA